MRSKSLFVLAMVCVMAVTNVASAELIQGIDIDLVIIGNAAAPIGHGAVAYAYNIGKYEVTKHSGTLLLLGLGVIILRSKCC